MYNMSAVSYRAVQKAKLEQLFEGLSKASLEIRDEVQRQGMEFIARDDLDVLEWMSDAIAEKVCDVRDKVKDYVSPEVAFERAAGLRRG